MDVWFLTIVKDGRVTLTSIMSESQHDAINQAIDFDGDVINVGLKETIVDLNVIVWANDDIKITLIRS
jgi:hypothetical protein